MNLCVAISILGLSAAPAPRTANPDDLAKMQGEWILQKFFQRGEEEKPNDGEFNRMVVEKDRLVFLKNQKVSDRLIIRVRPGTGISEIDFEILEEGDKGKLNHAIYKWVGEELWIALGTHLIPNKPEDRPKGFEYDRDARPTAKLVFVFSKKK